MLRQKSQNTKVLYGYLKHNVSFMKYLGYLRENGLQEILLPTELSKDDKSNTVEIANDNSCIATCISPPSSERDAGSVRANHPIPPQTGIYYFEMTILSKGRKCLIGIGLSGPKVNIDRLPGWDESSWGYHGDDGNAFPSGNSGVPYGPQYTTNDVVGCGINFYDNTVFFTKNGIFLGKAFDNVEGELYPTIGMSTQHESVEVNFGAKKFKFDVENYYKEFKARLFKEICGRTDDLISQYNENTAGEEPNQDIDIVEEETTSTINLLITSYLVHHGYSETAESFAKNAMGVELKSEDYTELGIKENESPKELNSSDSNENIKNNQDQSETQNEKYEAEGETNEHNEILNVTKEIKKQLIINKQGDLNIRERIKQSIYDGDLDEAISDTEKYYPSLLDNDEEIYFRLYLQKFIELIIKVASLHERDDLHERKVDEFPDEKEIVNGSLVDKRKRLLEDHDGFPAKPRDTLAKVNELLDLGNSLFSKFHMDNKDHYKRELDNVFALLAYRDPNQSPFKDLLDPSNRKIVAERLNRHILKSQGQPPIPALEYVVKHTKILLTTMMENEMGEGAFFDVDSDILNH